MSEITSTPKNILIGVGGGIAAYKSLQLIRLYTEAGHTVRVIPTQSALEFVGRASFEALSGNPVLSSVFEDVDHVSHVRLGQQADLFVIAPATADLMARMATGRADDLLTASYLVAQCPVVVSPAMHTQMWEHPATQSNVETLRSRGVVVLDPAIGRLTGQDTGAGRLPEPQQIFRLSQLALDAGTKAFDRTLLGKRLTISAGGTQEALDPVRFLGNHSSGKQGIAIAELAQLRGAEVELILGTHSTKENPLVNNVTPVVSAQELRSAVLERQDSSDCVIMAAAVADYAPDSASTSKVKKSFESPELMISLKENPDILLELTQNRSRGKVSSEQVIVGFAAETGDSQHSALEYAQQKLQSKGCDYLVCNDVSNGKVFGQETNSAWILSSQSAKVTELTEANKYVIASRILDEIF